MGLRPKIANTFVLRIVTGLIPLTLALSSTILDAYPADNQDSMIQETVLKLYRPFQELPSQISLESSKGQCWQQSHRIKREDAWRCNWSGQSYDPCFIKFYAQKQLALCKNSPWDSGFLIFEVASFSEQAPFEKLDLSKTLPWALELRGGLLCIAAEEGHFFDNQPLHYQCNDRSELLGNLQRCKSLWSALQKKGEQVSNIEILKAWF